MRHNVGTPLQNLNLKKSVHELNLDFFKNYTKYLYSYCSPGVLRQSFENKISATKNRKWITKLKISIQEVKIYEENFDWKQNCYLVWFFRKSSLNFLLRSADISVLSQHYETLRYCCYSLFISDKNGGKICHQIRYKFCHRFCHQFAWIRHWFATDSSPINHGFITNLPPIQHVFVTDKQRITTVWH
jgi:hypothetical protein